MSHSGDTRPHRITMCRLLSGARTRCATFLLAVASILTCAANILSADPLTELVA
jgi:hypothetical protein